MEKPIGVALTGGVGAGDEKNREEVEDEHQAEKSLRAFIGTGKFLPDENAPERGDHRCGLADRIRNRDAGEIGSDQVEHRAGGPDRAAEQTQHMTVHGAAEEIR